jgi:hypothetical protein
MKRSKIPYRLIIAVVAGIATGLILSGLTHLILHALGIFPPLGKPMFEVRLALISLGYHSVYAVIGAYITSLIAREKARKAVYILGTKEAIMWVLGSILLWNHSPLWLNIIQAVMGPPLALIGGLLQGNARKSSQKPKG